MSIFSRILRLSVVPNNLLPSPIRCRLLNMIDNISISKNATIREQVIFAANGISVGEDSFINRGVFLYARFPMTKIEIEDNVFIGPDSSFITISHEIGDSTRRAGEHIYGNILVKSGSWIGANVTVLPEVVIETGCVIGAGSVVTKSTMPNGMYAGVPARRLRDLNVN